MKGSTKKFAIGAVVAGIAGYVTGLLTAPKSGKETRKDIHDTAVKATAEAKKRLKQANDELHKMIEKAKRETAHLRGTVKEQADKSLAAIIATKNKIQNVIKEGSSSDKELKKALKEANDAMNHLKKYINQYGKAAKNAKN